MTVYCLEESDKHLVKPLKPSSSEPRSASSVELFDELTSCTDEEVTLVAHTNDNAGTVGGKAPAELAKEFAKKYADKTQLKHVFLISCEAGMAKDGKPSFAQEFAREMKKLGFVNVAIHAAGAPTPSATQECTGMRVRVVVNSGAAGRIKGENKGDVNAFFFGNKESEELYTMIEFLEDEVKQIENKGKLATPTELANLKWNKEKIIELKKVQDIATDYKEIPIFATGDYKTVMNDDLHTFTETGPKKTQKAETLASKFEREHRERIEAINKSNQEKKLAAERLEQFKRVIARAIELLTTQIDRVNTKQEPYDSISEADKDFLVSKMAKLITDLRNFAENARRDPELMNLDSVTSKLKKTKIMAFIMLYDSQKKYNNIIIDVETTLLNEFRTTPSSYGVIAHATAATTTTMTMSSAKPLMDEVKAELEKRQYTNKLINELKEYQEQRKTEWNYHYNFLGLVAGCYYIIDKITGSNHFNSKSREEKINAAGELIKHLEGTSKSALKDIQLDALNDGRLGELISNSHCQVAIDICAPKRAIPTVSAAERRLTPTPGRTHHSKFGSPGHP